MTINCPICGFELPGHVEDCPNRGNKICPDGHHKPGYPELDRDNSGKIQHYIIKPLVDNEYSLHFFLSSE